MFGKPASQSVQNEEKRRLYEALAAHGIQPLADSGESETTEPELNSIKQPPSARPIGG